MTSTIDPTIPADYAALLSAAVRGNFAAAANDISGIQGGLVTGYGSTIIGATTATASTYEMPCNSSAGGFRITVPFALGTLQKPKWVIVFKVSTDTNQITISGDGVTDYAYLFSPNDASGGGYYRVRVDGSTIMVFGRG